MTCCPGALAVVKHISPGQWKTFRSNRVNDDSVWRNEGEITYVDAKTNDLLIVITHEVDHASPLTYALGASSTFWMSNAAVTGT